MSKRRVQVGDKIWANRAGAFVVSGLARGKALVSDGTAYFEWRLAWCPVVLHWRLT